MKGGEGGTTVVEALRLLWQAKWDQGAAVDLFFEMRARKVAAAAGATAAENRVVEAQPAAAAASAGRPR